jgi:excisionase family DNA binding protein
MPSKQDDLERPAALSVSGIARELDISKRTAARLVETGELKAHRVRRQWRVLRADFDAYLARNANVEECAR